MCLHVSKKRTKAYKARTKPVLVYKLFEARVNRGFGTFNSRDIRSPIYSVQSWNAMINKDGVLYPEDNKKGTYNFYNDTVIHGRAIHAYVSEIRALMSATKRKIIVRLYVDPKDIAGVGSRGEGDIAFTKGTIHPEDLKMLRDFINFDEEKLLEMYYEQVCEAEV